ncbi:cytochrome P450 2J2-like isoform X1 [Pseudonaja textilis]|uniref:cytochrome P450 2J2-like isoform X1 n=1 Tax=Pseudonaja textilis TaxID=8673 RepID=UPI000EA9B494|nr:cytochrome P450 2J2-like isoform X1 [Pseudonaja textilis]
MLIEGFLLFAFFVFAFQFLQLQRAKGRFPPGPFPLPIFGNLRLLNFALKRETLVKLTSIYGNIYTIWLGTTPVVVLNGYKAVKEALVTYSVETSGRPLMPLFTELMGERGVFMTTGPIWRKQKRFVMMALRNLGMGKKILENQIQQEAHYLLKVFKSKKELPFDPRTPIVKAVSNIIFNFVFGHRFSEEDAHFNKLLKTIHMIVYLPGSIWGRAYDSFPTIMQKFQKPYQQLFEHNEFMHNFIKDKMQSHKERWEEGNKPQDLLDFYLEFISKNKNNSDSIFSEENMVQIAVDLLIGGAEASTTTLYWGLLYLLKYPDVQEKIHHEIDAILGPSQMITYKDRNRLPYTNAVLHEIVRYSNISITGPLRKCLKDIVIMGSPIGKGTLLLPNAHSVLYDPEHWKTPWKFNPEHFLDFEGNFVNNEAYLPFGTGRRACVGESLARIELFIFFTNLLRSFKYQLPPEAEEVSFEEITGSIRQPLPYNLCAFPREAA